MGADGAEESEAGIVTTFEGGTGYQTTMRACLLLVSICVWLAALTFAAPTPTLRSLDAELARLRVQLKHTTSEAHQQLPGPTERAAVLPREASPMEEVVVQQHATIEEATPPMAKVTV